MNIKRTLLTILSILVIFSLAACNADKEGNFPQESSRSKNNNDTVFNNIPTSSASPVFNPGTSDFTATEDVSTHEITTVTTLDNPAYWSKEQIIDLYKNAAKKSNAVAKSEQSITLKSISVNNGEYEGLFEFITPIMAKLLANNSTEKDGITGGFSNLVVSDVSSAKAYKKGNNIAVEMIMNEQTSGARDDSLSGSVGHAITAVGDIYVVTKQLKDLGIPLEFSEKNIKIYYTNPVVKVLINENGEIIKGTWGYTVDINLNNYKAFGKPVNTTSVVMDNTITVNGGF